MRRIGEAALWFGWIGTAMLVVGWPLIRWTSTYSFAVWLGLMATASALSFVGGIWRSRWFLLPGFVAIVVTIGTLLGAVFGK